LITAPSLTEVARRIDYLRLVPIDPIIESRLDRVNFNQPANSRGRRYNFYTRSCALLKAGARLERAPRIATNDLDIGRLRPTFKPSDPAFWPVNVCRRFASP
jgi:general secretion pathway protein F